MRKMLLLFALSFLIAACPSKVNKSEEMKENAIDVAGNYSCRVSRGSEMDMSFSVLNDEGKHQVIVKYAHVSFAQKERDFFQKKHSMNLDVLDKALGNPIVMKGENLSSDQGRTSRLNACSGEFKYDESIFVKYCIVAVRHQSDKSLRGRVEIELVRTAPVGREPGEPDKTQLAFVGEMAD